MGEEGQTVNLNGLNRGLKRDSLVNPNRLKCVKRVIYSKPKWVNKPWVEVNPNGFKWVKRDRLVNPNGLQGDEEGQTQIGGRGMHNLDR